MSAETVVPVQPASDLEVDPVVASPKAQLNLKEAFFDGTMSDLKTKHP